MDNRKSKLNGLVRYSARETLRYDRGCYDKIVDFVCQMVFWKDIRFRSCL